MKQRLKLLHCTGRIPCIDMDTGVLQDWITLEGTEMILDKETGACEIFPDPNHKSLEDIKKEDLLDDPLEYKLYYHRWAKVEGADEI